MSDALGNGHQTLNGPGAMKRPNQMSALEAAGAIEAGTLTCQELARSCLERIEQRNAEVRAFTAVNSQLALNQARTADHTASTGLLHGVPFAVKDVIETAEYDTTFGSPIYAGYRPRTDASCVVLAREQGAVLLGKVDTSEFATQTPAATRNPLCLERTPGGSSSGSAAAVADFMVPVAFGTQTTGSIIRPAAYCGVVGYKPTFGLIGAAGLKMLSPSQDTIGVLARDVADAAFFCFGLHGASWVANTERRPRVGICQSKQWSHASVEMIEAIERFATRLEGSGATVSRIQLPAELEEINDLQPKLFAFEARQSLADERVHFWPQFSPRLQARLDGGLGIGLPDYLEMRRRVANARNDIAGVLKNVDALLYPAAEGEAELGLKDSGSPRFGALWTMLHLPCISFPVGRGQAGMPLGAQLIGAYGEDQRLLSVASYCGDVAEYDRPLA